MEGNPPHTHPVEKTLFSELEKKLTSPARITFKNPNFQSFCEFGKTWKYSLRPTFKSLNFKSMDEWGKVMS